jgi:hypothetical protein
VNGVVGPTPPLFPARATTYVKLLSYSVLATPVCHWVPLSKNVADNTTDVPEKAFTGSENLQAPLPNDVEEPIWRRNCINTVLPMALYLPVSDPFPRTGFVVDTVQVTV